MTGSDLDKQLARATRASSAGQLLGLLLLAVAITVGMAACGGPQDIAGEGEDPWHLIRIEDIHEAPSRSWSLDLADSKNSIGQLLDVGEDRILTAVRSGDSPDAGPVDVVLIDVVNGQEIWRTRVADDYQHHELSTLPLLGDRRSTLFGAAIRGKVVLLSPQDGQVLSELPAGIATLENDELYTVSGTGRTPVESGKPQELIIRKGVVSGIHVEPLWETTVAGWWLHGVCLSGTSVIVGQAHSMDTGSCYADGPAIAVDRETGAELGWGDGMILNSYHYPTDDGVLRVLPDLMSGGADIALLEKNGAEVWQYSTEEPLLGFRSLKSKLYTLTPSRLVIRDVASMDVLLDVDTAEIEALDIVDPVDDRVLVQTAADVVWLDANDGEKLQSARTGGYPNRMFLAGVSENYVLLALRDESTVTHEIKAYDKDGDLSWTIAVQPSRQVSVIGGRLLLVDQDEGSLSLMT